MARDLCHRTSVSCFFPFLHCSFTTIRQVAAQSCTNLSDNRIIDTRWHAQYYYDTADILLISLSARHWMPSGVHSHIIIDYITKLQTPRAIYLAGGVTGVLATEWVLPAHWLIGVWKVPRCSRSHRWRSRLHFSASLSIGRPAIMASLCSTVLR